MGETLFVQWTMMVALALSAALPQSLREYPATLVQVVQEYCDFDLNIGRISSANLAKMPPLVAWEEEPGWDTVTVVSGFKILASRQSHHGAVVTVKWDVLGQSEAENVKKERKSEITEYKLKLVKGLWKIESPVIPPHVSLPTVRAFVLTQFKNDPQRQALWVRNLEALAVPAKVN